MENIIWVALLCAVLALLFAAWKTSAVSKADAGTERMKEIAGNISDGARAFLFAEYKILVVFVAILFVLIGLFISWLTAVCFLVGAVFSVGAGYVGMNVATKANVRTAAAAKSSGMNKALGIAFSGGSVMGMCVVGLGLLGCAAIYAFTGNVEILTGFSLGASSIALVLLGVSFFSLSYSYARGQKTDELLVRAQAVSKLSVRYLETGRYLSMEELQKDEQFRQLAATAALISEMDILVCDDDGHVLLSTDDSMAGQSVTIPQPVMEKVLDDGTWAGRSRLDQIYRSKQFIAGVPVVNPATQETLGAVFTVSTSASVDNLWRAFAGLLLMTSCVVLMISFMASSITTMRQIKPIREMARATRQYAEGDFDIRMNDYGREDEIGELAASFNNMAESLQQTERQRREFIANISHELKTPMTTIAGYTDGILDGTIPPENEKQYLQIIANESRRLSRLVRRMLDVSQLQVMDPLRGGNHFDICEAMRRVLISMEKKINDRHLDVDADIPDEPILVLGDNDMITQVIYNLLENAAKFAREGSTLYLGVAMMDGKARVTVRNVGDTIPAEELPLLFERFHKSDKSRSEDKDGYGLGLYIVKTILQQHKEEINVTSEDGVTTFTFSLRVE